MTHAAFEKQLAAMVKQAAGKPSKFLTAFSPIHVIWHARRGVVVGAVLEPVGFLTFHQSAILAYQKVLKAAGKKLPAPWGPNYPNAIDGIADPVEFSGKIENWHNGVHNSDMTLMNPATNIRRPKFWALHGFIEGRFKAWIAQHRHVTEAEHRTV